MLNKLLNNEKATFVFVGGLNTVICYLLFVLFYKLWGPDAYLQAYVTSYAISLVVGYTLQRILVFKVKGHILLDFVRYTLVQLVSFAVNLILLPLSVETFSLNPLLAQALILVVTVIGSYFAHRYFSFRRRTSNLVDNDS